MAGARRAVLTGGASGIGRAAAAALRRTDHTITVLDRNDPGDVADRWVPLDLDAPVAPPPALDGPIDVLVNAAGLPPRPGDEARILRTNFLALRRITMQVLPLMRDGGAVVNVASKAGARWRENVAQVRRLMSRPDACRLDAFVAEEGIDAVRAYDLSKEAVIAWTRAMTGPLIDKGLRMNCVSPAAVDTPILGDFERAFGTRASRGVELTRRAGRPEEVATVIAFLASPDAGWLRGCDVKVDGGLTAQLEAEALLGASALQAPG